jgi:hypothetical protein
LALVHQVFQHASGHKSHISSVAKNDVERDLRLRSLENQLGRW